MAGFWPGKSQVASLLAVYAAAFRDWQPYLAAGERATVAVIAADRQQARVCIRYIAGMLDAVPMLRALVTRRSATSIELRNRVVLEVHTCSFRSTNAVAGACVGAVADPEPGILRWMREEVERMRAAAGEVGPRRWPLG
jgi:hypothetical protein